MNSKLSRRSLIKTAAGSALLAGIGAPAIVRAQADAIRIGHLTPLTGFLGPLGEYAVMGIKLAAEEVNAAGGVLGRKIELVMEDSINPQTASTKAERMVEQLRPDIYVKGGDYGPGGKELPEAQIVAANGGRVALVPVVPGRSTTSIVERIRGCAAAGDLAAESDERHPQSPAEADGA
jgi:hypothetical protein